MLKSRITSEAHRENLRKLKIARALFEISSAERVLRECGYKGRRK